jgi:predicted GNAT family acetyltransferase
LKETNFDRMMKIVDDVFATRNDPEQLQVNEEVIEKLQLIHPATLSEYNEGKGPIAWILGIPTTTEIMNLFLSGNISEQQLFDMTEPGMSYDALYLCSATVLPEYRGKGLAKRLCCEAIESIRKQHPLKTLFVWPFTAGGDALAESVSKKAGLPLLKKKTK